MFKNYLPKCTYRFIPINVFFNVCYWCFIFAQIERFTIGQAFLDSELQKQIDAALQTHGDDTSLDFNPQCSPKTSMIVNEDWRWAKPFVICLCECLKKNVDFETFCTKYIYCYSFGPVLLIYMYIYNSYINFLHHWNPVSQKTDFITIYW